MKQETPSKTQIKLENKAFWNYLIKKHERLTMILDFNVKNGIDIIESDIELLHEEYEAFDNSTLSWTEKKEVKEESVTQKELYTDSKSVKA